MGGKKKKIVIKKIENKGSRAVTFTKRRKGLYAKASELCLLSGAKMAVLVTPLSSNSNFSFFSFGHSSVDSVVSAFLANQTPLEEEEKEEEEQRGLGFWWEDESLAQSNDPEKLRVAIDSITKMLNDLNKFRSEAVENREKLKKKKKKGVILQELAQTLNIESTSANLVGFNKNKEEQDQTEAITYKNGLPENFDGCNVKQDLKSFSKQLEMDDVSMVTTTNQTPSSDSENFEDLALMIQRDLSGEEFYLGQFIDFETNSTGLLVNTVSNQTLCSEYETVEAMVVNHKDLDEDDLKFSDYFNDLPSITTL